MRIHETFPKLGHVHPELNGIKLLIGNEYFLQRDQSNQANVPRGTFAAFELKQTRVKLLEYDVVGPLQLSGTRRCIQNVDGLKSIKVTTSAPLILHYNLYVQVRWCPVSKFHTCQFWVLFSTLI